MNTAILQPTESLTDRFIAFAGSTGQENKKLASNLMKSLTPTTLETSQINGDFNTRVDRSFNEDGPKGRWHFKVWRFRF